MQRVKSRVAEVRIVRMRFLHRSDDVAFRGTGSDVILEYVITWLPAEAELMKRQTCGITDLRCKKYVIGVIRIGTPQQIEEIIRFIGRGVNI